MKKFCNLLIFGLGYALTWIFDKLANRKNEKNASKLAYARGISLLIGSINGYIYGRTKNG